MQRNRRLLYPYKYKRFRQSVFDEESQCLRLQSTPGSADWHQYHVRRMEWQMGKSADSNQAGAGAVTVSQFSRLLDFLVASRPHTDSHMVPFYMFDATHAIFCIDHQLREGLIYLPYPSLPAPPSEGTNGDHNCTIMPSFSPIFRVDLSPLEVPGTDWYLNFVSVSYDQLSGHLFVVVDEYSVLRNSRIAVYVYNKESNTLQFRKVISTFTEGEVAGMFVVSQSKEQSRLEHCAKRFCPETATVTSNSSLRVRLETRIILLCKSPDTRTVSTAMIYSIDWNTFALNSRAPVNNGTTRHDDAWSMVTLKLSPNPNSVPNNPNSPFILPVFENYATFVAPAIRFAENGSQSIELTGPHYATSSNVVVVFPNQAESQRMGNFELPRVFIASWEPGQRSIVLWNLNLEKFTWHPIHMYSDTLPPPLTVAAYRCPSLAVSNQGQVLVTWESLKAGLVVHQSVWLSVTPLVDICWGKVLRHFPCILEEKTALKFADIKHSDTTPTLNHRLAGAYETLLQARGLPHTLIVKYNLLTDSLTLNDTA